MLKASAKALGITTDVNGASVNYGSPNGSITFSNAFNFDLDSSNGIASNAFNFVGAAIYEIGDALGFVSGVDSIDSRTAPGASAAGQVGGSLEGFVVMSQLDLFRYGSAGTLNWSTQGTPYFRSTVATTSCSAICVSRPASRTGDGRQASHWKDGPAGAPQPGVLDPDPSLDQM